HRSFDRIATLLGSASSRRVGLRAVIGAAIGAIPAAAAAKPHSQGPCGDTSREDNLCTKNSDCCTEICKPNLKNLDKMGRCRCRRQGEACSKDINCCSRGGQNVGCIQGICGNRCTRLGKACTPETPCCAGSCASPTSERNRGFTSGTCCLAEGESTCAKDRDCCGGLICVAGVCAAACLPLLTSCVAGDTCCGIAVCDEIKLEPGLTKAAIPLACCFPIGTIGCTSSAECCGSQNGCEAGTCTVP
ncbi:MAG: hypothetical protein ACR2J8_00610, partial [Thermomicrobiales bacterium]